MKLDIESQRHISDCHEEINRLKAINAELLAACEAALTVEYRCGFNTINPNEVRNQIKAAIANVQPRGEK